MSTPDEALAAALHGAMCDSSHHDRHTVCHRTRTYENIAASVAPRLTASGYAIVRSDELAGLRAAAQTLCDEFPFDHKLSDLRSALEGVSR